MKRILIVVVILFLVYFGGYLHGRLTSSAELRVEFHPPTAEVVSALFGWKPAALARSASGAVELLSYKKLASSNLAIVVISEYAGLDVSADDKAELEKP